MEQAFERRPWLLPLLLALATIIFLRPVVIPPQAGEVLDGNDFKALFYPLNQYDAQTLQSGELPLWNPHQFLGYPMIGEPHAALFYPGTWFMWAELVWVRDVLRGERPRYRPALDAPPVVEAKTPLPEKGIPADLLCGRRFNARSFTKDTAKEGMTPEDCQKYLDELTWIIDDETRYGHNDDVAKLSQWEAERRYEVWEELAEDKSVRDRFLQLLGSEKVSAFFRNRKVPREVRRMKLDPDAPAVDDNDADDAIAELAEDIVAVDDYPSTDAFVRAHPKSELAKHAAGLTADIEKHEAADSLDAASGAVPSGT